MVVVSSSKAPCGGPSPAEPSFPALPAPPGTAQAARSAMKAAVGAPNRVILGSEFLLANPPPCSAGLCGQSQPSFQALAKRIYPGLLVLFLLDS